MSPALTACLAAVCLAGVNPGAAGAHSGAGSGPDAVTLDPAGQLAADGTVTLSGTYRCSPLHHGRTVLVGAKLIKGDVHHGIGGTVARCDGREHNWRHTGQLKGDLAGEAGDTAGGGPGRTTAGRVDGEATLLKLEPGGVVPVPVLLDRDARSLVLQLG
ncbi:DUF6299 family protein [Streptomyces sp. HNM0663]|uniref:DUF6299 family protein n=1 Tax=Streptomyces chengmaiensis TaxID=3040919 RepID=A0ABT6HQV6_9ACTN|nr:DUF6299 family protein [Streptomyces chengmaiensis]MDH2390244.1 DUF6299 family protein [Streptomyces chengmaiensis]